MGRQQPESMKRYETGTHAFSLIELLVVIGIIAAVSVISVPVIRGLGQSNVMTSGTQQLLDDLRAGKVKYGKPGSGTPTVSVYGDTAVVRGQLLPSTHYSSMFINQLGVWKAVAMHTSN